MANILTGLEESVMSHYWWRGMDIKYVALVLLLGPLSCFGKTQVILDDGNMVLDISLDSYPLNVKTSKTEPNQWEEPRSMPEAFDFFDEMLSDPIKSLLVGANLQCNYHVIERNWKKCITDFLDENSKNGKAYTFHIRIIDAIEQEWIYDEGDSFKLRHNCLGLYHELCITYEDVWFEYIFSLEVSTHN